MNQLQFIQEKLACNIYTRLKQKIYAMQIQFRYVDLIKLEGLGILEIIITVCLFFSEQLFKRLDACCRKNSPSSMGL